MDLGRSKMNRDRKTAQALSATLAATRPEFVTDHLCRSTMDGVIHHSILADDWLKDRRFPANPLI
jgi:hypothetical protein